MRQRERQALELDSPSLCTSPAIAAKTCQICSKEMAERLPDNCSAALGPVIRKFQDRFEHIPTLLFDSAQQKSNIQWLCLKWKARPKNREATLHHLFTLRHQSWDVHQDIRSFSSSITVSVKSESKLSKPRRSRSNCRTLIWKICIQLNTQSVEILWIMLFDTMRQHFDPHLRLCGKLTPGESHLVKIREAMPSVYLCSSLSLSQSTTLTALINLYTPVQDVKLGKGPGLHTQP